MKWIAFILVTIVMGCTSIPAYAQSYSRLWALETKPIRPYKSIYRPTKKLKKYRYSRQSIRNIYPKKYSTTREWGDSHLPKRLYVPPPIIDPRGRQGKSIFPTSSEMKAWEKAAEGTRRLNQIIIDPMRY